MVAAQMPPLLEQQDAQFRALGVQAPGDQTVGQAAADQDQVVVDAGAITVAVLIHGWPPPSAGAVQSR
jgi:hypothetical protein